MSDAEAAVARPDRANVRALTENDAVAWWDLRLEALETDPLAFGKSADEHRAIPVDSIAQRFRNVSAGDLYLGAFAGERLVGMATFIRDEGLKDRHKGRIFGVYVTASHRRKGVGKALVAEILARATRDTSLEQIMLAVVSQQEAPRQLYLGCGFVAYGTEPNALKVGSTYYDEDLMVLRLR